MEPNYPGVKNDERMYREGAGVEEVGGGKGRVRKIGLLLLGPKSQCRGGWSSLVM